MSYLKIVSDVSGKFGFDVRRCFYQQDYPCRICKNKDASCELLKEFPLGRGVTREESFEAAKLYIMQINPRGSLATKKVQISLGPIQKRLEADAKEWDS